MRTIMFFFLFSLFSSSPAQAQEDDGWGPVVPVPVAANTAVAKKKKAPPAATQPAAASRDFEELKKLFEEQKTAADKTAVTLQEAQKAILILSQAEDERKKLAQPKVVLDTTFREHVLPWFLWGLGIVAIPVIILSVRVRNLGRFLRVLASRLPPS
jgi:hypothetical protein